MSKHLVIPDTQQRAGVPSDHMSWIGEYILEKKPDVIVHLGDHADMPSLSVYDKGKISFEGRRYKVDIDCANDTFLELNSPIIKYNIKRRRDKKKLYNPRKIILLGNHEDRISRCIEDNPILDGTISIDDLDYSRLGWEVIDYLDPIEIDGLTYCHYFYNRQSGRPYTGYSMETRLKNVGFSFVQGHQQMFLSGIRDLNNGRRHRGIVAGACYLHCERYRGPQARAEWRGVLVLHSVKDGDFDLLEVPLDYLCRKYEGMSLRKFMDKKYPELYNPF